MVRVALGAALFGQVEPSRSPFRREHPLREDLAHPVVDPLAGASDLALEQADAPVARLLVRSPAPAVLERDPVVHSVEAQAAPGASRAEPHCLGSDPAAIQVVAADEQAALAVAADPVDVEDPGEADRLALIRDGPTHAVRVLGVALEALLRLLLRPFARAPPPESRRLGLP